MVARTRAAAIRYVSLNLCLCLHTNDKAAGYFMPSHQAPPSSVGNTSYQATALRSNLPRPSSTWIHGHCPAKLYCASTRSRISCTYRQLPIRHYRIRPGFSFHDANIFCLSIGQLARSADRGLYFRLLYVGLYVSNDTDFKIETDQSNTFGAGAQYTGVSINIAALSSVASAWGIIFSVFSKRAQCSTIRHMPAF